MKEICRKFPHSMTIDEELIYWRERCLEVEELYKNMKEIYYEKKHEVEMGQK